MPCSIHGCAMASIADTAAIQRPRKRRRVEFGVVLALAWLIAVVALAVLAPYVGVQNPDDGDLLEVLSLPSMEHWLGTDSLGRDTFARAIYGAQVSLTVALGSVGVGLLFGGALGLMGGYFGRWPDRLIMGAMTVLLCFPGIILAIALVSSLGPSVGNVTFAIGVIFIPAFARIARANTLSLRSR